MNICSAVIWREGGCKPVISQLERLGQLELKARLSHFIRLLNELKEEEASLTTVYTTDLTESKQLRIHCRGVAVRPACGQHVQREKNGYGPTSWLSGYSDCC